MKQRFSVSRLAVGAGVVWLGAHSAATQIAPVRVLASNGVRAAVEELKPACERAVGRSLTIDYGSSAALKRRIEGGEAFDLAILTPETTAALVSAGRIANGTAVDLASIGIGFGIRAGSPKPDIATPEAMKQTLLKAKSISIVKEGASRAAIEQMFERLGIAEAIASKVKLESGTEVAGENVAQGRTEIEIVPLSEIPLVNGVQILGPLPGDLQHYLRFQAALSANAKDAGAATKAIQFLTSPAAAPVFKAKGMEPK
ncbi:MAG: substrate-binding domain-containing protein [Acidobacteriota bacterium]